MSELKFNYEQVAIIEKLKLNTKLTDIEKLFTANGYKAEELETLLRVANAFYRLGQPIIEDVQYDEYWNYLKTIAPDNPSIHRIEHLQ